MGKRVKITEAIQKSLRLALGDPDADAGNYAVFEARFLSTEPLSKKGFFDKARISANTLSEMSRKLNAEGNAIPLQVMHKTDYLPVGKVISAKVLPLNAGGSELRGHFVIPLDKKEIIADIENSIIDEVSVGLLTKKAQCSACGFDYFGSDTASMMARMNRTCPNEHSLGENGTHLVMSGMDDWSELSLVGKGAASQAKILTRAKQSLGQETLDRLAASGAPLDAFFLTASYEMGDKDSNTGVTSMDLEKLTAQLSEKSGQLAEKTLLLTQATAALTAKDTEIADLKAKLKASEDGKTTSQTEMEAKLASATKELADAFAVIQPHVKAALVASGVTEAAVPANFKDAVKLVEEKGLKLHQIVGAGAKSDGGKDDGSKKLTASEELRMNAFKLSQ